MRVEAGRGPWQPRGQGCQVAQAQASLLPRGDSGRVTKTKAGSPSTTEMHVDTPVVGGGSMGHSSSSTPNFATITLSFQLILRFLTRLNNSFCL